MDTTKKIIAERGEPTPFTYLLNGIFPELDKQGVFFIGKRGSEGIEEVLREHLNATFVLAPIVDTKGTEVGKGWWLKDPSSVTLPPLSERVEKRVINTLNNRVKVSFDDVLQDVFINFPNAMTPNTQTVHEVLEEYALKTPDKKWILKPKFRERQSEHDQIVKALAELGQTLGYEVHADLDGYRKLDFPFKAVDRGRVSQIDVIWFNKSAAIAAFEVEHTTGVTEAIVRGGNIDSTSTVRVLVMPEERIRLLRRKVHEPILAEQIKKYNWTMITYGELQKLLAKGKKLRFETMRSNLISLVDFKLEVQESMHKFMEAKEP